MMRLTFFGAALLVLACQTPVAAAPPGDWPGWRRDGTGISADAGLPTHWDARSNVVWRTPLAGEGNSSPIIAGGRIFLTAWQDEGKKRSVLAFDAVSGQPLWQRDFAVDTVAITDPKNGYASSTCVTDGQRLFAFFDAPGLVALDLSGRVLWQRPLGPFSAIWGMASSPVLYKDLVIIVCDHQKGAFVAAFDKATGAERWRTPREDQLQFATPLVFTHGGKDQMVVNGVTVASYDPATGRVLWTCKGMRQGCTPTAQYSQGLVWVTSGRNGPILAIDPSGSGELSETHVRVHRNSGGCYITSPLAVGHWLLLAGDKGHVRLVDAAGKMAVATRMAGHFSSSPILAGNRIYWSNEKGVTYVFGAGRLDSAKPELDLIAANDLGEPILASPAVCDGRLFLRTAAALYCLAGQQKTAPIVKGKPPAATLAELRARLLAHPNQHGSNVAIRLDVIETASRLDDPELPSLLLVAVRDKQWDVSTAAAHALGRLGHRGVNALIDLLKDYHGQEYLNVIAADYLGELRAVAAVPRLLDRAACPRDGMVRQAAIRALAKVAQAPGADSKVIMPALIKALSDKEGSVRAAAVESLASLAPKAGEHRDAIVAGLKTCAADANPLVSSAARRALAEAYN